MSEQKNAFQKLNDIYQDALVECDKKGFADVFKKSTEMLFDSLAEEGFHAEDIRYLDGYFMFPSGTNSVVHFNVKECHDWLFGIWWDDPEEDGTVVSGTLFTQYAETCDKFKPERSICVRVGVNTKGYCDRYKAVRLLKFIVNEPYLAFCRDYNGWDYNEEFHSREEAKAEFSKFTIWNNNKKLLTKECDDKILTFVRERILPQIPESKIVDRGDSWSPRFEVVAPSGNREPGFWDWDEFFTGDEREKVILDFKSLREECDKTTNYDGGFCWFCPIDQDVLLVENEAESGALDLSDEG